MPDRFLISKAKRQIARLDARISVYLRKYERAESEIERILLRGILSGELWKIRNRRRLRSETQDLLRALYREREAAVDPIVTEHFMLGSRIAEAGLRQSISQSEMQKAAMRLLSENLVVDLGNAIETVGRRVDDVFRKEGLRAAREKVLDGEETPVNRTMRKRLVEQGVTSFIDAKGRRWSLERYASMVIKTVTSEALNTSTQLALVERGFDVVEINSVRNPCKVCLPYNGEVVSFSGEVPGLMHLKEIPPFHPECRHFIFPNARTIEERARRLEVTA